MQDALLDAQPDQYFSRMAVVGPPSSLLLYLGLLNSQKYNL